MAGAGAFYKQTSFKNQREKIALYVRSCDHDYASVVQILHRAIFAWEQN